MSVIFTLTEAQWQDLVQRMYHEGVVGPALDRGDVYGVALYGTVADMMLFLTHVAEVIGPQERAMEHVRYLADKVVRVEDDRRWQLPVVRVERSN